MLYFPLKEVLILWLLFIVIVCLLHIRTLKKQLAREIYKRLHPQVQLELITYDENNEQGLYIKNDSFFLLKDITIPEIRTAITDSGFKQELILRFNSIDFLKSKEKIKLAWSVFDKDDRLLPNIAERFIPHLLNISFPVIIRYATIEGRVFSASFMKKRDKFYEEKIEILQ